MPIVINPGARAAEGGRPTNQVGTSALEAAESGPAVGAAEDARVLGAALHEVGVMTSETLLARALG